MNSQRKEQEEEQQNKDPTSQCSSHIHSKSDTDIYQHSTTATNTVAPSSLPNQYKSKDNLIYREQQQRELMHQIDEEERQFYEEAELYDLQHKTHHNHCPHVILPKKGASRALWIPSGYFWCFPFFILQWIVHAIRLLFRLIQQTFFFRDSMKGNHHTHHSHDHHHHHHHEHHRHQHNHDD